MAGIIKTIKTTIFNNKATNEVRFDRTSVNLIGNNAEQELSDFVASHEDLFTINMNVAPMFRKEIVYSQKTKNYASVTIKEYGFITIYEFVRIELDVNPTPYIANVECDFFRL